MHVVAVADKFLTRIGLLAFLLLGVLACTNARSNAYNSTLAPAPYGALPSARQLRWHEMEMYCLIHFTPITFQNKEWGYGDASPEIFNPSTFDAKQIALAAKSAGFKGLILVAKP